MTNAAWQRLTQPHQTTRPLRPRPVPKRSYRAADKSKTKPPTTSKHVHFGGATVMGYSAETKDKAKDSPALSGPTTSSRPGTTRQSTAYSGRPTGASTRQASYSTGGRPTGGRQGTGYGGQQQGGTKRSGYGSGYGYGYEARGARPERLEVTVSR
ncbi:hypothetical protein LTR91_007838 [Friedmanniomyces endolithicus]|nr:hypothetical protein LTS09_012552 [Friedmanniomyces endolithicus]KAK0273878.1 hypothetical protein LTR35_012005 [Friedmanniomyces endolithicus]KAK0279860.1 hypothetical protein LTS00_013239 [Friedmanniomyces endolithicus]KAK0305354.1 hypothetical protein LTR01_006879 [Friedmanniomyces endolithicus]KAK0311034.1 hypothetical protein LTR82_014484 [Friedmanniomyces endolithicus]